MTESGICTIGTKTCENGTFKKYLIAVYFATHNYSILSCSNFIFLIGVDPVANGSSATTRIAIILGKCGTGQQTHVVAINVTKRVAEYITHMSGHVLKNFRDIKPEIH
jgi:hypothetical protein